MAEVKAASQPISSDQKSSHPKSSDPKSLHPRPRRLGLGLEAFDLVTLLHRQPDFIEAVEQRVLAVRIYVEFDLAAVGTADFLFFQIDGERGIGAALGV